MLEPKHTTIRTHTPVDEDTVSIETKKYYEKLASIKQEIEQNIKTDSSKFLSDLIAAVSIIKEQKTQELNISIKCDERFLPKLITKTYTTSKERFDKR